MRSGRTLWRGALVLLLGVLVGGGIVALQRAGTRQRSVQYITRPARYADITATVTETGTVNPVDEVQVGSQVSGTIATIAVDYNSRVRKGQVLATLDPAPFQAAVAQASATLQALQASASAASSAVRQAAAAVQTAEATLRQATAALESAQATAAKAQSQLALARLTVERDRALLAQGFIPQNQVDADQTAAANAAQDVRAALAAVATARAQVEAAMSQRESARAQLRTAEAQRSAALHQVAAQSAQLRQAQYNLSRTVITSPIDGIVMARNVSVGQTVAASFQTPTLFTLASNLTDMQVDTSVDEADVGSVRPGEPASITVTAYPNVTFRGTVRQVRVNPTVVQNVVTYDAVVAVHDTSGRLKPGMTAQVTIIVGRRAHVLAVPIAALLYRPLARVPAAGQAPNPVPAPPPVAGAPGSEVTVWVLRGGHPAPVQVTIGLSDGRNVEVLRGGLRAGDPVIIAQAGRER